MDTWPNILVLGRNLLLVSRITNMANSMNLNVSQVSSQKEYLCLEEAVNLVLIDLETDFEFWTNIVSSLREKIVDGLDCKIVAFGPHRRERVLSEAREAGCDLVITNGQLSRDLREILESV